MEFLIIYHNFNRYESIKEAPTLYEVTVPPTGFCSKTMFPLMRRLPAGEKVPLAVCNHDHDKTILMIRIRRPRALFVISLLFSLLLSNFLFLSFSLFLSNFLPDLTGPDPYIRRTFVEYDIGAWTIFIIIFPGGPLVIIPLPLTEYIFPTALDRAL